MKFVKKTLPCYDVTIKMWEKETEQVKTWNVQVFDKPTVRTINSMVHQLSADLIVLGYEYVKQNRHYKMPLSTFLENAEIIVKDEKENE